jgi:hypothetical protein
MSMIICQGCDRLIDSDDDPGCFLDVGSNQIKVLCESCRERLQQELERETNAELPFVSGLAARSW